MKGDLRDLLGRREIFRDLQDIAEENPKILHPGSFFDWMCRSHIIALAVSVRSFVDFDKRSHSLARLLYEMLEHPKIISREWHVRMYRSTPLGEQLGHMTFNNVVGKGRAYLSQGIIRSDLRRIEDASERVRRFVNKRIAHRANPGAIQRLPRLKEFDSALDTLDEVLCKYNLLLTAEGTNSLHATRQYDWREVLWEPWILPGSKYRGGGFDLFIDRTPSAPKKRTGMTMDSPGMEKWCRECFLVVCKQETNAGCWRIAGLVTKNRFTQRLGREPVQSVQVGWKQREIRDIRSNH